MANESNIKLIPFALTGGKKAARNSEARNKVVIGGPGTGKTSTLMAIVEKELNDGHSDNRRILVLCLSAKAAEDAKKKLNSHNRVEAMTLHSFGAKVVNGLAGRGTVISAKREKKLIDACFKETFGDGPESASFPKKRLKKLLLKAAATDYDIAAHIKKQVKKRKALFGPWEKKLLSCAALIKSAKSEKAKLTCNDQINGALERLDADPKLLAKMGQKYKMLLVDEFQDLSLNQHKLVLKLSSAIGRTVVAGDDAQSIYGFRGVVPDCFQKFKEAAPYAKEFRLTQSLRCSQQIAHLLNEERNTMTGVAKSYLHSFKQGRWAYHIVCPAPNEMDAILAEIVRKLLRANVPAKEIRVLARLNDSLVMANAALRNAGLPTLLGDRGEIEKICDAAKLMLEIVWEKPSPAMDKGKYAQLLKMLDIGKRAKPNGRKKPADLLDSDDTFLRRTIKEAKGCGDIEYQLDAIMKCLKYYMDTVNGRLIGAHFTLLRHSASACASQADILKALDDYKAVPEDAIKLQTVHASKGSECDAVIVIDAVDGYFPHASALYAKDKTKMEKKLNEERKLLYVAMSRARGYLFILARPGVGPGAHKFAKKSADSKPAGCSLINKKMMSFSNVKTFSEASGKMRIYDRA
jgi:DNA helicase-2/ATP-dependent DNA helicase PcrA